MLARSGRNSLKFWYTKLFVVSLAVGRLAFVFLSKHVSGEQILFINFWHAAEENENVTSKKPLHVPMLVKILSCSGIHWAKRTVLAMSAPIDVDKVAQTKGKVAYAIPGPSRHNSKGWALDPIPLISRKAAQLSTAAE